MRYYLKLVLSGIAALVKLFRIFQPSGSHLGRPGFRFRQRIRREWVFVLCLTFLTNIAVLSGTCWYYRYDFHYQPSADNLYLAHHKLFTNETVPLEGKRYVACTFRNVVLEYDGTAPFALEHNSFSGSLTLTTKNKSITSAIFLLKGLGMTSVPIFDSETGEVVRNLDPPRVEAPMNVTEGR